MTGTACGYIQQQAGKSFSLVWKRKRRNARLFSNYYFPLTSTKIAA